MRTILVVLAVSAIGCGAASSGTMPSSIDLDEPLTVIAPRDPLHVWLGRGSGMDGLELVYVGPHGEVELYRQQQLGERDAHWEHATLTITPSNLIELRGSIAQHRLLALETVYQNGTADGTQWILAIVQEDRGHLSYFDNVFPDAITQFAYDLDQMLAGRGLASAAWRRVPNDDAGEHDDALWDALREARAQRASQ